jgi:TfoX/Sxy family transcriptional regulator of competence genes
MSFLSSEQKALVDRIGSLVDNVEARMMLGTVGLFASDQQFGVLDDDRLYLSVDDESREAFVEVGTEPYSAPNVEEAAYLRLPGEVTEDTDQLFSWVERAVEAAD